MSYASGKIEEARVARFNGVVSTKALTAGAHTERISSTSGHAVASDSRGPTTITPPPDYEHPLTVSTRPEPERIANREYEHGHRWSGVCGVEGL